MSKCSIRPIDRTLLDSTTPARVELGAMAIKRCSTFPKAPALPEPQYQIV